MFHELPEVLEIGMLILVNAQACGGPPEVAPPPGEHARLHGLLRWEEGEHVVEETVGEVPDTVGESHRRCRTLALPLRRHSVKQAADVDGAARQETIRQREGGENGMG